MRFNDLTDFQKADAIEINCNAVLFCMGVSNVIFAEDQHAYVAKYMYSRNPIIREGLEADLCSP